MYEGATIKADTDWIILRTAGKDTLRLAKSLEEDGFEVWSPSEPKEITEYRTRLRRQITVPLLASYVFAPAKHRSELFQLAGMEVRPRRGAGWGKPAHAGFSVMCGSRGALLITDRQLTALRQIETRRAKHKKADVSFTPGDRVRVGAGVGAGMEGTVIRSNRKQTKIDFGSNFDPQLPTSILVKVGVGEEQP
jgi:transcription antitermination factor NusG